jgi:hypothetical protein
MGTPRNELEKKRKNDFLSLKTTDDVADYLGIRRELLKALMNRKQGMFYKTFQIRKKSGGLRDIRAPIPYLKNIQRRLSKCLYLIYKQKAPAHGFCRDKTILTNSDKHKRKELVFNLDLSDFFQSISDKRVRGVLMANPYNLPPNVAECVANICCVDGSLPQGAPTSPILSNIVCSRLDSEIQGLAIKNRCFYTRYADDITFSTTEKRFGQSIVDGDGCIGSTLENLIKENSFVVNEKKTRLKTKKQRQRVTGLTVNEFTNVGRDFIRNIRTLIFLVRKYGSDGAQKIFQENEKTEKNIIKTIKGKISFIRFIRGEENRIYQKLENSFCSAIGMPPRYVLGDVEKAYKALWILECDESCGGGYHQGTGFDLEGYGIVTCGHVFCTALKAFRSDSITTRFSLEKIAEAPKAIDLVVLKITGSGQKEYPLKKDIIEPSVGADLIAVGFPEYGAGMDPYTFFDKCVGRRVRNGVNLIMIGKNISGGMSGGPLLNKTGSVVGIIRTGDKEDSTRNGVIPVGCLSELQKTKV